MNKFQLIDSINDKRVSQNKATLNSLAFNLISDSSESKGQNEDGSYNVKYSNTGYFITEVGGQLLASRAQEKEGQDVLDTNFQNVYIGNIYPNDFEYEKMESSGLIWSEEQKARELSYAQKTYKNLTEDEEEFLSYKMEVYAGFDAKTVKMLQTRNKDNKLLIVGRYDFSTDEYSIEKPVTSAVRGRGKNKGKEEKGNKYWDRIKINVKNPRVIQIEAGKDGYKFLDLSTILEKANFKVEAEQLAKHLGTKTKFVNTQKQTISFESGHFYRIQNGFGTLKNKEKEVINRGNYFKAMASEPQWKEAKKYMTREDVIKISKNTKEGILVGASTVKSRSEKLMLQKTKDGSRSWYQENFGNISFNYTSNEDGEWKDIEEEFKFSMIGDVVKADDEYNYIAVSKFDKDNEKSINHTEKASYMSGYKIRTSIFLIAEDKLEK